MGRRDGQQHPDRVAARGARGREPTAEGARVAVDLAKLRASVTGRVIGPADAEYDKARTMFTGGIDRRPAVIVRVAGTADVARVIGLARTTGLPLAVRSGGHSVFCVTDGGIVLDLSEMRALDIDVARRTAWVEPGLTAGAYTAAAGAHGLATGFGDTGSVGVGGITVGGGVGFLVRKYGMTIDDLLAADVVTADGRVLRVDAEHHPDLFWAIRGGGGNFGVVTRLQLRLHEVPSIVGGMLFLPATADTIAGFVAAAAAAPEELSTIANVMTAPPMPFLPPEVVGKPVLMAMLCFAGATDAGERAVAPFRTLATPYADMVATMPYSGMYQPDPEDYHPVAANHTMLIDRCDRGLAETILDHLTASTASLAVSQIRVLGGAMARIPSDATAFAHRGRRIMVNVAALYEKPDEKQTHERWVAGLAAALQQGERAAYVNFLVDEGEARVREAYPQPTWDRLAAIKRRHDPTNLFRLNQNIPPA